MGNLAVDKNSELVRGVIPANARLGMGFEQLQLVITDRRIIVAHKAKKGAGGLASMLILGSHSGVFIDPDKPKGSVGESGKFGAVNLQKILASNRDNFEVGYEDVVTVEIDETRESTIITLVTSGDKFQFFTALSVREVSRLLASHLGLKLLTRKKPAGQEFLPR
jgi:Flp pilus assembly secretin CpaC